MGFLKIGKEYEELLEKKLPLPRQLPETFLDE